MKKSVTVMKLLPYGPVIRLAGREVGHAGMATVFSRSDWSAGRNLSPEESRCGILVRMAELEEGARMPVCRPRAVIRVQSSDYQLNEVSGSGVGAFLQSAPKGRWKKLARQKTILVENDTASFGDPQKSSYPRVQSFGEYARRFGRMPNDKPVLKFVMYRDHQSMSSVVHRLQYELGVESDAVLFSPSTSFPGGFGGCISQYGYAVGVSKELLPHASRHYNLHPLIFDPREYMSVEALNEATQTEALGCFCRVLLRCVNVGSEAELFDLLKGVSQGSGFVNYFGLDRFGVGGNALFHIAALRERGHLDRAVGSCLQLLAESQPLHYDHYLSYVNADNGTAAGMAKLWRDDCAKGKAPKWIRSFIHQLAEYTAHGERMTDEERQAFLTGMWHSFPVKPQDALNSASEFVWNSMASERLLQGGLRVLKGDLVLQRGDNSPPTVHLVKSDEEVERFSLRDVVLPVPYSGSVQHCRFPEVLEVTRCRFEAFATAHSVHEIFTTSSPPQPAIYRHIVEYPQQLQAALLTDPSSLAAIKNDLFVRQERQPIESLGLSYAARVREPSVFNVSQKLRESISCIQQVHKGDKSVVLSFILPKGSSPLVFLREVFDVRHAHFQDLYGMP